MPAGVSGNLPLSGRGAVASATTDGALIAAQAGARIYVLSVVLSCAGTATTVTLNTKPGGGGAAIFGPINLAANSTVVLPIHEGGYCRTNLGEGLTATTGTGSTVTVEITYAVSGSR